MVQKWGGWTTCIFDHVISNETCDKFSITFEVISFGDNRNKPNFLIGYALKDEIEESMKDWTTPLGEGGNSATSASWNSFMDSLYHNSLGHFSKERRNVQYSVGDKFTIIFDFEQRKAKLYLNDKEMDCTALNVIKLWIGVSVLYAGTHIKMVGYKYD